MRASTRWTMFSVTSCSPPEIHILLPNSGTAAERRVAIWFGGGVATSARTTPPGAREDTSCRKSPLEFGAARSVDLRREPWASSSWRFAAVSNGYPRCRVAART